MQSSLSEISGHGATLVAISPQKPEHSLSMVRKYRLGFDILSDPGNEYASVLGMRFAIPPSLKEIYQGFGLDIPGHNDEQSWTLPMPGRLVVDRTGIVRVVDVDPDYTRRPEPEKTVTDLASLE